MTIGWEDFPEGRVIETDSVTVTKDQVVQFSAATGGWYKSDPNREAAGLFGERVAYGPLVFAIAVGLMYQSDVYGNSILAWLGADRVRALAPVRFGDSIHVAVTVTAARASRHSGQGVVTLEYRVLNQSNDTVMSFDFVLLMRSRQPTP